ncbi:unnamed protein product (macronuclear) [Paramecium tetraurelia]|uniref:Uncharacterized protein n=1 Tax=Paramecium tetraurelia TaxID=5888 RepID=A0DG81_PARTE|nr:uncharacterized protein GSPATT00002177001 [Paramecium tetraurelia]CAK82048.1 unnamed protein product [Paramecium tetraurelia]|eukprot:XP_001449445.1 hypothetical protein (macronuclear) [Paramecium tetraurelia strain d4-2]
MELKQMLLADFFLVLGLRALISLLILLRLIVKLNEIGRSQLKKANNKDFKRINTIKQKKEMQPLKILENINQCDL